MLDFVEEPLDEISLAVEREITAWQRQRNAAGARIKWMFTTDKARAKMGRAYPDPAAATRDAQLKES